MLSGQHWLDMLGQQNPEVWGNGRRIEACIVQNDVFDAIRNAAWTMTKMDALNNTTINHPASSCHWINYEGVSALDMTIFDG